MLNRRVLANIVIFGLIGVLLAAWAATNVLSIDAITHPYAITADFGSSPGLRTHFEVAYLGVKVGSIDSVKLGRAEKPSENAAVAIVRMKIDHGRKLPVGVQAAALRQSPVGEPYVELSPPAGYRGGGPFVGRGYVIPTRDTSAPLSYQGVFDALNRLIQAVPPDAVHTLVHELAAALNGRADSIRSIVENADSLTSTLAANSDKVQQLISDLTQVSRTLADHGAALGSSVDNLAAITGALAQSRQSIDTILGTGPDFARQVATVLAASDANLGCLLDGLGLASGVLSQPVSLNALAQVLGYAPRELALLPMAQRTAPVGSFLYGTLRFTATGPPVPLYASPKKLPAVPAVPACPGGEQTTVGAGGTEASGGGHAPVRAGPSSVTTVTTSHPAAPGQLSSAKPVSDKKLPFGWPLVVIVGIVVLVALTRPWRLIRRGR